jgi:hypothetical protein
MVWNLFEKIINAVKPHKESQQVSDTAQQQSQDNACQQETSQNLQETASTTQPNKWRES